MFFNGKTFWQSFENMLLIKLASYNVQSEIRFDHLLHVMVIPFSLAVWFSKSCYGLQQNKNVGHWEHYRESLSPSLYGGQTWHLIVERICTVTLVSGKGLFFMIPFEVCAAKYT